MKSIIKLILIFFLMNIMGCKAVSGNMFSSSSNLSPAQLAEIDEQAQDGQMRNIR